MAQMTAVLQEAYGGPEVLALGETRRPEPATGQVLVRVRAAGLNAADWHIMRGLPLMARLSVGLRAPRGKIRGSDVAGVVEAVGAGVTRWEARRRGVRRGRDGRRWVRRVRRASDEVWRQAART